MEGVSSGPVAKKQKFTANVSIIDSSKGNETDKDFTSVTKLEPIDLMKYTSAKELESVGADRLKGALIALKMKCGGTLEQRGIEQVI